ncbi:MAG: sugar ABC transporter permease [Christensenellaceae bacterium]|nr:sugar ABC transporter permease [Christensenellaceae bacterium]
MQKTYKKYFAVFVLPILTVYFIAFLFPLISGVYLSFTKFKTVSDAEFVGLSNYAFVFSDVRGFLSALKFTAKFTAVSMVTTNLFAFILALLLTKGVRGTNTFRTIFFMPNLIGGIVLGYIWQIVINGVLIKTVGVDITYSAKYGFWGMVILYNWQMIGYLMIIYIAGLQAIPSELMEAAEVDGANKWQVLKNIKLPLVMPAITICLFLTLSGGFKMFDQNFALTNGAPRNQTTMLALDIYNTYYKRIGFAGVGQAKAVVFTLMVVAITFLQVKLTRSKEVD